MPKSKPDQVVVHRIELQKSERDALEAALAGRFLTNAVSSVGSVLTGIGSMLAPFTPAFGAIAAALIAERGVSAVAAAGESIVEDIIVNNEIERSGGYQTVVSWLQAQYDDGGWEQIINGTYPNGYQFQLEMWQTGYFRIPFSNPPEFWVDPNSPEAAMVARIGGFPPRQTRLPGFLCDRFAIFIQTIRTSAGDYTQSNPVDLWVEFFPYDDYRQWLLHEAYD